MDKQKSDEDIILVKNLVKKFNSLTAVDNISFEVKKGEIFAFLGPNGAGKSTTIKMLTTLLDPTSGEMKLNGFSPDTNKDEVRKSFGIVFQDPSLDDDLTAHENMHFHAFLYKGGMKRRLEIARGLLHHPKILFLDEPTLGLDPQTRNHVWTYIKNVNDKEKMTVFFTTHYMEEAEKIAQRIAIIDHGKIVAAGTVDELIRKTKTNSLEEAFLSLTGHEIREETATAADHFRFQRMHGMHRH